MALSKNLVQAVRRSIEENPYLSVSKMAGELHATEADIVMALPVAMRTRVGTEHFGPLWQSMSTLRNVLVVALPKEGRSPCGPGLSFGSLGGGDGSLYATKLPPLEHLRKEAIGSAWFVSNALLSEESHSVRFFDKAGGHILSVFLRKDGGGRHDTADKETFEEARKRFGVTPVPKMRCRGCASCTCADKKERPAGMVS